MDANELIKAIQNGQKIFYNEDFSNRCIFGYFNELNKHAGALSFSDSKFVNTKFVSVEFINCHFIRVNFEGADLSTCKFKNSTIIDSDFTSANLAWSVFHNCSVINTEFNSAELMNTYFDERCVLKYCKFLDSNASHVSFKHGTILECKFNRTDLSDADFSCANCQYSVFNECKLDETIFSNARLYKSNFWDIKDAFRTLFYGADMTEVVIDHSDFALSFFGHSLNPSVYYSVAKNLRASNLFDSKMPLSCPENGSFRAFKVAQDHIIELCIPNDAKRTSACGLKCRCNKAKVIHILNLNGTLTDMTEICSDYDNDFIYKVGETVEVKDFDENRYHECAPGVHFYMDFDNAVYYWTISH